MSSTSSDRGERHPSVDGEANGRNRRGRSADREAGTGALVGQSSTGRRDGGGSRWDSASTTKIDATSAAINEEDWCLSNVIFVEDGRTQPVGIVLKVDGNIAAVKFLKVCPHFYPPTSFFVDSSSICLRVGTILDVFAVTFQH